MTRRSEEKVVPPGVVLITVGGIILLTVMAIWCVAPVTIPYPVYVAVSSYLPGAGAILPTRAAAAVVPERAPAGAAVLLPETPLEATTPLPSFFVSALDAPTREPFTGQPVRIMIPRLDLEAPVVEVDLEAVQSGAVTYYVWQVPQAYQAGWHNNSALLGQPGNTVLNGHHNLYGEVFRYLVDLQEGDTIILHDRRRSFTYEVTHTELFLERGQPLSVRLENAQWMAPTDDERVTLVTCWPYTDNSHRLIVVAHPVTD